MPNKLPNYYSFLLRLWKTRMNGSTVWRVSVENPRTKVILGFNSVQQFTEHLKKMLDERED